MQRGNIRAAKILREYFSLSHKSENKLTMPRQKETKMERQTQKEYKNISWNNKVIKSGNTQF